MPHLTDTAAVARVIRAGLGHIDQFLSTPLSWDPWDTPADRLQELAGTAAVLTRFVADPAVAAVRDTLSVPERWPWDAMVRQVQELDRRLRGMQYSNPAWSDALFGGDDTPAWFGEQGGHVGEVITALTEVDGSLAAVETFGQSGRTSGADIVLRAVTAAVNAGEVTPETSPGAACGALNTAARILRDRDVAETVDQLGGSAGRPVSAEITAALTTAAGSAWRIAIGADHRAAVTAHGAQLRTLTRLVSSLAGRDALGA